MTVPTQSSLRERILFETLRMFMYGVNQNPIYPRDRDHDLANRIVTMVDLVHDRFVGGPQAPDPVSPADASTSFGVLAKSVDVLEFEHRIRSAFWAVGVYTIGDLVDTTANDLLKTRNFGTVSLNKVHDKLADLGLALRVRRPK